MKDEEILKEIYGTNLDTIFAEDEVDSINSEEIDDSNENVENSLNVNNIKSIPNVKNISIVNKSSTKEENIKYEVSDIPWAIKLSGDGLEFKEFNKQEYKFIRLYNPDGEPTNYYSGYCKSDRFKKKDSNFPVWRPLKLLLSNRYYVVRVEKFLEELKKQVTFLEDPIINTYEPFKISIKGKTKVLDSKVFGSEGAKLIFSIITGSPVDSLDSLENGLDILCINSYDGSKPLGCNFTIKFIGKIGKEKKELTDYFTLSNCSYSIEHIGKIEGLQNRLTNASEHIKDNVKKLKAHTENLDKISESIASKFPKEAKKKFLGLWEGCVGDLKNLYYLLICASVVLDSFYNITRYTGIKKIVNKVI